ncbi:hypothetical protein F383_32546 [Gossypium arboreum]|uniref:Uncharacterized protein n=1 Tax=Gossypium arboreum TaxID=29729 RepID=A0A0B0N2F2_GOSAR|nr:hypothetical protein F383_32546 [Gossypium arboreum]
MVLCELPNYGSYEIFCYIAWISFLIGSL